MKIINRFAVMMEIIAIGFPYRKKERKKIESKSNYADGGFLLIVDP